MNRWQILLLRIQDSIDWRFYLSFHASNNNCIAWRTPNSPAHWEYMTMTKRTCILRYTLSQRRSRDWAHSYLRVLSLNNVARLRVVLQEGSTVKTESRQGETGRKKGGEGGVCLPKRDNPSSCVIVMIYIDFKFERTSICFPDSNCVVSSKCHQSFRACKIKTLNFLTNTVLGIRPGFVNHLKLRWNWS